MYVVAPKPYLVWTQPVVCANFNVLQLVFFICIEQGAGMDKAKIGHFPVFAAVMAHCLF